MLVCTALPAGAEDDKKEKTPQVYPAAVLPFQERGRETKDQGSKVTDLLFAKLAVEPGLTLVEREDIKKLLEEQELNLSGLVNPQQATKVGQLTGAKLLITGSVLQVDNSLYLIAKIIGTETSRVVGASVKGNVRDDLGKLTDDLSAEIVKTIAKRADDLVAKPLSREDRIAALKKKLGDGKLPSVLVEISEQHTGQVVPLVVRSEVVVVGRAGGQITIDPAAETEVTLFCKESGFTVIDPKEGRKKDADILIQGEAFSEHAVQHGNLDFGQGPIGDQGRRPDQREDRGRGSADNSCCGSHRADCREERVAGGRRAACRADAAEDRERSQRSTKVSDDHGPTNSLDDGRVAVIGARNVPFPSGVVSSHSGWSRRRLLAVPAARQCACRCRG